MTSRSGVNSRRAQTLIAVREMVLRGELAPPKTIEEVELSKALGASRPIVRATLEKLHQEGLLEQSGKGIYVPRVMSSQDIADAIEARGALESVAAGLAARRGVDAAQLDQARRANAALGEATASFSTTQSPTADQMARFGELNLTFHKALVALAGSPMIELSLDRVQSIAFASPAAVVTPADAGGFAESLREHEAILNAIEAGDAACAEKLVREHARFALRGVRNAIERPDRDTNVKPDADKETRVQRPSRPLTRNADRAGPTSELLLDAAAALFCEKGFNETTTREIAARLNIHQASLYYHVSGKEELLHRISKDSLEALERRVAAAIRNCGSGRDRLKAFIRGHLEGMFENPDRAFAFISEFRSLSRAHRREMRLLRRNHSDLLKQEIASAVKAGILRRDISVSVLRLALFNYLNWTPRWYHVSGRLPLAGLAGIYSRVFFEGVVAPGHGRPALPQRQSQRRRRQGAGHNATLDKFVRTAAELFSRQGYASTSTRALSALIGMEKATLYYHVRSKEDLLYLIAKSSVETLQQDVQKAVDGITCPLDHLAVLMRAHCVSLLRDQTQHATVLAEVRALSPERLAEIEEMRKKYQTGIRRIIEAGQKNKSIRPDVEPRYLACMLQGLLDRTVEWYQKSGSLAPAELADALCEIFLFGAGKAAAQATER
jgi:AcrR family transcriptional regulator/DNA-binding GntR family transcriptional regulator